MGVVQLGVVQLGVVQMGIVQLGVVQVQLGSVQMGVVQLGVVQLGVVQMGVDLVKNIWIGSRALFSLTLAKNVVQAHAKKASDCGVYGGPESVAHIRATKRRAEP